ncbi:tachylectin-related carbohydrate-binding protein [Lentzea sp. NPDC034063]|uniref:tachylectin-related carbohydrate-binding protein n=1 Tax=unclassified Lentzea TaxID=2643253 RepID=UPI0033E25C12
MSSGFVSRRFSSIFLPCSDLGRFATSGRDLVTVDAAGDIYRVDTDGTLRRFVHDGAKWAVDGQEIAKGWDRYNLIVAAGPGVLYARAPSGGLRLTTIIPKG